MREHEKNNKCKLSSDLVVHSDVNPFMREIIDCFNIDKSVCKVIVQKGTSVGWSTSFPQVINKNA